MKYQGCCQHDATPRRGPACDDGAVQVVNATHSMDSKVAAR